MSIFDQTTGQQTNQAPAPQTNDDWLAKVVEVKGESFKDIQTLAKSKLESDNYIKSLEDQLKELREELSKEAHAKKLLDQLQNKAPTSTNGNPATPNISGTDPSETKPVVSEEFLKALVDKTLTEREQVSTAKQNAQLVAQQLAQKYGTEAKAVVEKKAQSLGMSLSRLEELAQESPNAFFTLIGEPQQATRPIVQGSINTQSVSMQAPTNRDWQYYQNLRRTNKSLYYDPKTQQQMFQDKMRLGDKFGNT